MCEGGAVNGAGRVSVRRGNLGRQSSHQVIRCQWFWGRGRSRDLGRAWAQKISLLKSCNSLKWPEALQWIAFPVKFLTNAFIHWMPGPHSVKRHFFHSLLLHPLPKIPFQGEGLSGDIPRPGMRSWGAIPLVQKGYLSDTCTINLERVGYLAPGR